MKKTILVLAPWYPTRENPFAGIFFKEQVDLLSSEYQFVVLHMTQTYPLPFQTLLHGKVTMELADAYENVKQYAVVVRTPLLKWIADLLLGYYLKYVKAADGQVKSRTNLYKKDAKKKVQIIRKELSVPYDLVYGITSQGLGYEAQLFAQAEGVPLVLGEHGPFPWPGGLVDSTLKESLEGADCFFAISNDKIRQVLLQNIKPKKIRYVGNPVDETLFTYDPAAHPEKTLLIVAAHSFYKNYDLFIETIDRLSEKTQTPFRVIVAGYNANKGYSQNAEALEQKIAASKFADRTELIGAVDRKNMPALYHRADAFVMTSIQEGQPVSALEAGFCGLPIFSTRCGGVEDYVTAETGRIVSITDSEQLAEYLRQFVDGEINFDGRHIREYMVARFGREAYKKNVTECFNGLMAGKDRRGEQDAG